MRGPRSPASNQATGLQVRLEFLCRYQWSREKQRPRVMAVRTEAEILDWVEKILEIRHLAKEDHFVEYLDTEHMLLDLTKGKLPSAIQLRASFPYRTSPRVRVAEALYGANYSPVPSVILRQFQEATGWGPAAFEEKLTPELRKEWERLKVRESMMRPDGSVTAPEEGP